jgi:hypothetical protein
VVYAQIAALKAPYTVVNANGFGTAYRAASDTGDLAHSQKLLAHNNRDMTEHYVKARMEERVTPLR